MAWGVSFDPRAKLAFVVSVVFAALITSALQRVALLLGFFVVFLVATGGMSLGLWVRSLKPVIYLLPVLLVLNTVFYASGTAWWAVPVGPFRLALTSGGLETAVLIAVRLLVIAGAAAWFAGTTGAEEFELALHRLGVPWSFAFLLSLTLRLVPEMRRRFRVIEDTQRSRGLDLSGGPIARTRARIPMMLPFFVAVIRYGYELSEALTARGFEDIDERTSLVQIRHGPADVPVYLLSVLLLAVFLVF